MTHFWTFRRTVAAGFTAIVTLNLVVAAIALIGLHRAVQHKDRVIDTDSRLVLDAQRLLTIRDARAAANRGYLISGQKSYLAQQYAYDTQFSAQLAEIRRTADTARGKELADRVASLQLAFLELDKVPVVFRQEGAPLAAWSAAWVRINSDRERTTDAMNDLARYLQQLVDTRKAAATRAAADDTRLIVGVAGASVLLSAALAQVIIRRLRRRVGGAVSQVRTSSVALEATANEQAVGAQQQSTAVTQISTTLTQLLTSSEQITGSAGRVAETAGQTASAGREGTRTVDEANGSIARIGEQLTTVLEHVSDLGDKSRQIGAVIDIVSELADQTNILAVNASIEAAGAGETGRRFGVVADEIRRLADRVSESAHEIRELIDSVRQAVETTTEATAIQAGAVESGSVQFAAVATSFKQIVSLVASTSAEAQEIALSTAQQTIAVEQVNLAIRDVAQSAAATEVSSGRTLRTASELHSLSADLQSLIDAGDLARA